MDNAHIYWRRDLQSSRRESVQKHKHCEIQL
jgi:hypothetical protein